MPCAVEKLHESASCDFSDIPLDPFSMPSPKLTREEAIEIADRLIGGERVEIEKSKALALEAEVLGSKIRLDLSRFQGLQGEEALMKALVKIQDC